MLEIRPNCELCDKDLPPTAPDAMICSYECTYCADCVERKLHDVCPTCGGNFTPRPIRPRLPWRKGKKTGLGYHPASTIRKHMQYNRRQMDEHVARIKDLPPDDR